MIQDIYIIDNDDNLSKHMSDIFKDNKEYRFKKVLTKQLDIALKNIPALIIINEDMIDENIVVICQKIRKNEDNNITPIIVVSSNESREHKLEILENCVEHIIPYPIDDKFVYYSIVNILKLLDINRRISPLTGLPGNVQIQAEMKKRLLNKDDFAMIYFDLDNFKAYNDIYGFFRGDEVIKFTAKTILKNIHSMEVESGFVGHIGGDDFIAIVSSVDCESVCQNIIAEFDKNIINYYTEEDVERGYIEVENRKGIIEQFPIVSISVGVVEVNNFRFRNILEIGEAGAQVKGLAKSIPGSTYVIDKREHR